MPPSANEGGIEAMELSECFSEKLLARRWGLSHRTLERWRHDEIGPAYLKIGGRIVYRLRTPADNAEALTRFLLA